MIKKKRWHCLPGQPLTELDKQVMFWENKGKLVPTRDLIKTPEQIEGIRLHKQRLFFLQQHDADHQRRKSDTDHDRHIGIRDILH